MPTPRPPEIKFDKPKPNTSTSPFTPNSAAPLAHATSSTANTSPDNVLEITGSIKWFNAIKGYGFITPDNGIPDVLLHVTCLRAGGYQTAFEGACVHAQVVERPKGLQALRVLSMDNKPTVNPEDLHDSARKITQIGSTWERAMVKNFDRERGFGFLTRGDGIPDIFVHMTTLRRFGFTELRTGQIIQVRSGMGEKGCMAAELRPDQLNLTTDKDMGGRY